MYLSRLLMPSTVVFEFGVTETIYQCRFYQSSVRDKCNQISSPLTTSSSNVSSVEDIFKPEYLSPTGYYCINSFCQLQRTFRAFQWHQMWRGGAVVPFSSSFRNMAFISASSFYGKRKSKHIILFIEQILAWNVVGIFYISLLTTHSNIVWIIPTVF